MKIWNEYTIANSIEQARESFDQSSSLTYFIAGGSDLLIEIQQGRKEPAGRMIDISQISELKKLEIENNHLFIGAGVSVSEIAKSKLVIEHAKAVSEATGLIGGPQVRNVATLGGNVAHALPAADGMISLAAMDAKVRVACGDHVEDRELFSLFLGPGKSALKRTELITGFLIKSKQPGEGSAFQRIMRPQGVALPIINCAVWLKRKNDSIADIRIVFGPSGPVPTRAEGVEKELRNMEFTRSNLENSINAIRNTVKFRTSQQRATAEYRYMLAEELLRSVIHSAWERTSDYHA